MTPAVRHVRIRRLVIDQSVAGSAPVDRQTLADAVARTLERVERAAPTGRDTTPRHHLPGLAALIGDGLARSLETVTRSPSRHSAEGLRHGTEPVI